MPDLATSSDARGGAARFAWFDGILEGRPGNAPRLREIVARVNAVGFGRMDLELEGGKFSLLMDDHPLPPARMAAENLEHLFGALQEIAGTAAPEGRLESTVRYTEVYDNGVRETLFGAREGSVEPVSRWRSRTEDDLRRAPREVRAEIGPRLGRRQTLLLGGLLLVTFLLLAWNTGYVDRLLAPRSDSLAVRLSEFEQLLAVEPGSSWGDYLVTVRRGPAYPSSNQQIDRLQAEASTPLQRAAINAVTNGSAVYLRLEDGNERVLASVRVELRALLRDPEGRIEARLPGRIAAKGVRVALDSGHEPK